MRTLPTREAAQGVQFTVADFVEAGRERLCLEVLVGGRGLEKVIEEPVVSRAGLALTGFFEHFPWQRVQMMGNAEWAYIRHLGKDAWRARFNDLIERKAHLFVFTDGHRPTQEIQALAENAGVVILTTCLKTRVFSRLATFVLERLAAPLTSFYGTMVEVSGLGILIEGDPGVGKSETALGLIKQGAALIADDLTCLRKDVAANLLYGSASDSTAGYMEIRGIGILHVPTIFGITAVRGEKRLQLIITFKRLEDIRGEVDRIGQQRRTKTILGVDIPHVIIPVSEGRDLVNLVETAAQKQKLIMAGYDPAQELSEHLHRRADTQSKNEKRKGKRNVR